MGVREVKNEIRDNILARRRMIPAEEKEALDRRLTERFLNLLCFKHARSVILYASLKLEPDTQAIIGETLRRGKRVALPRCVVCDTEMDFYEIQSPSQLGRGSYGIMEPLPELCGKVDPFTFDIVLVPALAFDRYGYRIGYGKGYYDRFLDKFCGTKVGMTYSDLLQTKLPRGRFDRKVDIIVTEKGVSMVADR